MRTANELIFAALVAVGAILVPQAAAVVLLALIYIRLEPRLRG
jgi:hypothetical protein